MRFGRTDLDRRIRANVRFGVVLLETGGPPGPRSHRAEGPSMVSSISPATREAAARCVEALRERLLGRYQQGLVDIDSRIVRDPRALSQAIEHADQTLSEMVAALRTGEATAVEGDVRIAESVGIARANQGIHPNESLTAITILFETVLAEVASCLADNPAGLELVEVSARALIRSIMGHTRAYATSYISFLLETIHQAHLGERARVARELHDQIGSSLGVAHRQLELFELYRGEDPERSTENATQARLSVQDTLEKMRLLISGLRQIEVDESLEKALLGYVDAVGRKSTRAVIRVNGDERWASTEIRDELFLIIREAIRNALAHAGCETLVVQVDISPHEVHAIVHDDGSGFERADIPARTTGLASMRERTELLGGVIKIDSATRQGTRVEILVPLPGET